MRVLCVSAVAALLVATALAGDRSGGVGGGVGFGAGLSGGVAYGSNNNNNNNNNLGGLQGVGGGFQSQQGRGVARFGDDGGIDDFDDRSSIGDSFQRGTAQVSQRNQHSARDQALWERNRRKLDNADAGATRKDDQERRSDLRESAFNRNDAQAKSQASNEAQSFDQNRDWAKEQSRRQNDLNDKHGVALDNVGRYDRQDAARNSGDKALAQKKNAFARRTDGFEKIDYGFAKDFDTNFAERGGFKESVGQDNNNLDVYEEKQRDNRFSKAFLDAFRRSRDNNAFNKQNDWLSNAAQKQDVNQRYGAADRLQNAAEQQNIDFNSNLDRKNDKVWNRDNAQDLALREAKDLAEKRADSESRRGASASGLKGVKDSKYYGGGTYSGDPRTGNTALGTGSAGGLAGTGGPYSGGSGPRTGSGLAAGGNVAGVPVTGKGRNEKSGGDYVNSYAEDARQQDLSNQRAGNRAQSDAKALNNYNRQRGVDDSIEVTGQQQGKWASEKAGLRDANSQGFNNNDAEAAKAAQLADNSLDASRASSSLEAANKNQLAQELDRVNFKRNQVDNNQRVRKQKKFYHDKNEGGFNNEALNYNRNRGNRDWAEDQAAQKEARTRFDNAAEDAKVNTQGRSFENLDARRVSNADATNRQKDDAGGWASDKENQRAQATANKASLDSGKALSEFDSFAQAQQARNQQLWDDARKDRRQQDSGKDSSRQVDAAFVFTPDRQRNRLGTAGGGSTRFGSSGGSFGGQSRFGVGGKGPSVSSGFGASFMGDVGSNSFGQVGLRGGLTQSGQGQQGRRYF